MRGYIFQCVYQPTVDDDGAHLALDFLSSCIIWQRFYKYGISCWCKLSINFRSHPYCKMGAVEFTLKLVNLLFLRKESLSFSLSFFGTERFRCDIIMVLVIVYVSWRGGDAHNAHQWPWESTNAGIKHIVSCILFTHFIWFYSNGFVSCKWFSVVIIVCCIQIGFNFRDKLPIKKIHWMKINYYSVVCVCVCNTKYSIENWIDTIFWWMKNSDREPFQMRTNDHAIECFAVAALNIKMLVSIASQHLFRAVCLISHRLFRPKSERIVMMFRMGIVCMNCKWFEIGLLLR